MLARREPVTLRSLVADVGVSTMAVYTHFGGMSGLWSAVRQEGFSRLGHRLAQIPAGPDSLVDLAAITRAYVDHAATNPDLYRAMFDEAASLKDPDAADATFKVLGDAVRRAADDGQLGQATDPDEMATQLWLAGHGACSLLCAGVLDRATAYEHARRIFVSLCTAFGATEIAAEGASHQAWRQRRP